MNAVPATPLITCPWEEAQFFFYSSNVPDLIFYSHITAMFAAMLMSTFVLFNNPRDIVARLFFLFSSLFTLWAALDMALWATNSPAEVMFSWSVQVLLEPLIFFIAFLTYFYFVYKRFPGTPIIGVSVLVLLPLILLLHTPLNLESLQLSYCESNEGPIAQYYSYISNGFFLVCIIITGWLGYYRYHDEKNRKISLAFGIGLFTFLMSFTSGNIISSFTDDWTISQYGLFGMPLFAAILGYSIVKYNAFNVKLAGAHALTLSLWVLVGSLLLVIENNSARFIVLMTLAFVSISGFLLAKSISKEIKQREQLEKLTLDLEKANERLKELDKLKSEFVSIASHQLRSPLTAIRGYASMIAEGSFGKLPQKAQESAERIAESARLMATSVEDYLNVSRIESGNMKYEYSDFNYKDKVEEITDELRPVALKKGLVLLFRSKLQSRGVVHADVGKAVQIAHNLINNAIKYTEKGSVSIFLRDDIKEKRIYMDVTDTGIGMSQKTIDALFQKFSRAEGAHKVNSSGTGLGLFVASKMAEAMGGSITAHSDGEGKGSTFTLELPLAM